MPAVKLNPRAAKNVRRGRSVPWEPCGEPANTFTIDPIMDSEEQSR
jgi:hypothetical protein